MRAAKVSRRHANWVIDDTAHRQAAVAVRKRRAWPRSRKTGVETGLEALWKGAGGAG